ncbi:hypothetical protein B0H16DRAFT_1839872 [Mycena metata]|uniref:Uncharacterized protein n=1 Tax=Mycena metata TaxID=1033252 RepID=A0AAD7N9N0_9AGAR|nr:hypothetical protein B0H16DRAFT_1839872 [Mycena metata]
MSTSLTKKKQEAACKAKCKEKKRKRDDSDEPKPRSKKRRANADNENNDSEPTPIEITRYIHVLKATPTFPSRSRTKPKPEELYVNCPPAHIAMGQTEWKPQTPANCMLLPLGGSDGFPVLQKQMCSSKDKIIIVTMPAPQKPTEDAPVLSEKRQPIMITRSEQSVEEQKILFEKAVAPHVEALKAKWPENDAGKRIYTDEKGYQWELTPICPNIWGSHLARGTATVERAPLSVQFDIKNCIKTQPVAVPVPAGQQVMLAPAPASLTSADKLMELFTMWMMMWQMQQPHFPFCAVSRPACVICSPSTYSPSRSLRPKSHSTSSIVSRDVSLGKFCTYYGISQHSHGLEKLGYKPGDKGIVTLEREDWNGVAGFGKLTWDKVLTKHHQLLKDAQTGLWM